MKELLINN